MKMTRALAFLAATILSGRAHAVDAAAPERPSTAQPNVHVLAPMTIPGLERQRTVRLYLPPDYEASHERYAVLYMRRSTSKCSGLANRPGSKFMPPISLSTSNLM